MLIRFPKHVVSILGSEFPEPTPPTQNLECGYKLTLRRNCLIKQYHYRRIIDKFTGTESLG